MKHSKVLHISGLEKFIPSFIDLIKRNGDFYKHTFFLTGDNEKNKIKQEKNIILARNKRNKFIACIELIKASNAADKIILHGLSDPKVIAVLFSQPWLLKKCYWFIWGADLYNHKTTNRNWRWKIKEFFLSSIIKHIGHLVTYIEGDIALARRWYGARGQHHECIMYPSNVYQEYAVPHDTHCSINIQIGNSATPSNNHLEIFERLLPFRDQDIQIFAPLSYGNQEYAKSIIESGTKMFGGKFHPMVDFMTRDKYLAFLGAIDIAIFNHDRQQAMGNTITLLGLGKKVYLRHDVTPWAMLEKNRIIAYNVAEISLTAIDSNTKECNRSAVKKSFSEEKLISQLNKIFEN